MVKKSPSLLRRVKPLVAELTTEFNDGVFKPLASDSDTLDGLNIHCVLMDEIHQWKQGKALYDIMADGITAREQPLISITSTAGTIREDIYDIIRKLIQRNVLLMMKTRNGHCTCRSIYIPGKTIWMTEKRFVNYCEKQDLR